MIVLVFLFRLVENPFYFVLLPKQKEHRSSLFNSISILKYSEDIKSKATNPLDEMNELDIRFTNEMSNKDQHSE